MSKIVTKTLDDCRLTPRRKRALAALAARPDSEIDFSDIPEATEQFWKNAIPNPLVRLDADVIAWLRKNGKGYQTRLNALLRSAMLQESAPRRRRVS
jgi:uncharacterized protein (DUF4415 family)